MTDIPVDTSFVDKTVQAIINDRLSANGLTGLGQWAWEQYKAGIPLEQIWIDMYTQPAYEDRFPGMAKLRKEGRSISEGEYIDIERSYYQIAQFKSFPNGFLTRKQVGDLIGGNVAPTEFSTRADHWVRFAYETDPLERAELLKMNPGMTAGDMAAYIMDPQRAEPLIAQQFLAAQLSATGIRTGYGALTPAESTQLAQMGITAEQAQQGFSQLNQQKNLLGSIDNQPEITRQQQLDAAFGGNTQVQKQIAKRAAQSKANFSGGSQVGRDKAGQSGFATANT